MSTKPNSKKKNARVRAKPPRIHSADCVVHDHPVPPEEIGKYSPVRDADSEQDIANYVHGQARDEMVKHVEKVKTEYVLGDAYEIWDVTTDRARWWVITNLTNLYSQEHFPSLDYTLSFHIGLMMRLRSRAQGPDASELHPFDEVFRRQEQAKERYERAIEAVDHQAVGMQLRECLLSVMSAMRRRVEIADLAERPQDANFTAWMELLMNRLCGGAHNKDLRQYLKTAAEKIFATSSHLISHHRGANLTAPPIFCTRSFRQPLMGHAGALLQRAKTDNIETCPLCLSRNIRSHFDINIEPDGAYYATCGQCEWSSHPMAVSGQQPPQSPQ